MCVCVCVPIVFIVLRMPEFNVDGYSIYGKIKLLTGDRNPCKQPAYLVILVPVRTRDVQVFKMICFAHLEITALY